MTQPKYRVTITAVGEVRDSEGNLVERVPMEQSMDMTQEELEQYIRDQKE
jgi:molybdopterin synthase catalytic subunit